RYHPDYAAYLFGHLNCEALSTQVNLYFRVTWDFEKAGKGLAKQRILKFGFKKVAKKNDFILIEEVGDAFRQSGQNPPTDVVKDMIEKAKNLKRSNETGDTSE
ncbi:unnamed protein product, partial [Didymodactylos carnosus]